MQAYLNSHPAAIALFSPVFLVALWCVIFFLISQASGWAVLARRFRLTSTFTGQTWAWKRARMRWGCNYNNCLTIGSDPMGLYLSMVFPFRFAHPPLLLPWQEVSVRRRRSILFFKYVELSLGREEQIPLLIRDNLADQIRQAAGSNWPVETVSWAEINRIGESLRLRYLPSCMCKSQRLPPPPALDIDSVARCSSVRNITRYCDLRARAEALEGY